MVKSKIQNNIRRLRFNADELTQQQLADKAEVSRQTIVAIEKGNESLDNVKRWMQATLAPIISAKKGTFLFRGYIWYLQRR